MKYSEWKNLVKEYKETDSTQTKTSLKIQARKIARNLCGSLERLYSKWGQTFVNEDEYYTCRGGSYSLHCFNDDEADLVYSYYSRCGDDYSICITVPMKYLDEDNIKRKNAELRKTHIQDLTHELSFSLKSIEQMQENCNNIRKEIVKLEEEQKMDIYSPQIENEIN